MCAPGESHEVKEYWIIEVGDDEYDEELNGPYRRFDDAMAYILANRTKYGIYTCHLPERRKHFVSWLSNLSALYILERTNFTPTWTKDILPHLKEKKHCVD